MKNSAIVRIVIWAAVIVLMIVAAVMMFNGGGWSFNGISFGSGYKYPDSASYSIGDFSANAETVSSLDIEWISGSVTVIEHDGDDIDVSEEGSEDKDTALRYRIKDGRLSIRFCKSGWNSGISFGIGRKPLEKDLTILVPKGKQFREIDMELVSAELDMEDIAATNFEVETVSGAVNLENLNADDINIGGVSASVTLENLAGKTVDIETVSGRIELSGTVDEVDFNTVSGGITAEFDEVPRTLDIETVSGGATIEMPKTGISADIESVSGSVEAFGDKLGKSGEVTVGDGYMKLNVDTVSGGVEIKEK